MLNDTQRRQAIFDGAIPHNNLKASVLRAGTSIRNLVATRQAGLSDADIRALECAVQILYDTAKRLQADAREAKHIKADYEKHVERALHALSALPTDTIADCVAVIALETRNPVSAWEMDSFRRFGGARWSSIHDVLKASSRHTVFDLARTCAREKTPPAYCLSQAQERLPAMKITHAALINELNALAVAEQMEASA